MRAVDLTSATPEFGLGLVSLGRVWGHSPSPLPSPSQVHDLLTVAVEHGIRVFDTAPAYGTSEQLVGEFMRSLAAERRDHLVLATKFGEHWDAATQSTMVDHSYDALVRSIDTSFARLGSIDVLQIHKTTAAVLRSDDTWRALEYAQTCGVSVLGASVSDVETAELALEFDALKVIQLPFNVHFHSLGTALRAATERNRWVWTNRPFAMGRLIHEDNMSKRDAYRFVISAGHRGVVLTGTSRSDHLLQDLSAFEASVAALPNAT